MSWFSFLSKKENNPSYFVVAYQSLFADKIPGDKSIETLDFTVLDTETTGLNIKKDDIVSYGSIKVIGYRIMVNTTEEYYLKSSRLDKESIKIHGLVKTMGFTSPEEFCLRILANLGNSILVAHHAGFDVAMLEKTTRPFGLRKILNPVLDTRNLAIRLEIGKNYSSHFINPMDYSLDKLCDRYRIPLDDRHTAAGDAFLTAQLLVKLLKIAEKMGIETYKDLLGR